MKLSMTGQMRMEQRMKLAPRMIQSMEILQLPTLGLIEKIETELNSNPTLEISDSDEPNAGEISEAGAEEKAEQIRDCPLSAVLFIASIFLSGSSSLADRFEPSAR
jgi:DNA-directed RNA polymerase specialized sigma54-like protein